MNPSQYQVVVSNDIVELSKRVVKLIDEGWVPCGGIATDRRVSDTIGQDLFVNRYYQAMTR